MSELKSRESDQISTRLSSKEVEEIARLVKMGFYMNTADFVRQSIREKLETVRIVNLREVPRGKAKKEILTYLGQRPKCHPSDIADALQLDYGLVIGILQGLVKEGRVR